MALLILLCVRNRNRRRLAGLTDKRLVEWEGAMAQHRAEQLETQGALDALGGDEFLKGGWGRALRQAKRLSAAIMRPLSALVPGDGKVDDGDGDGDGASTAQMVKVDMKDVQHQPLQHPDIQQTAYIGKRGTVMAATALTSVDELAEEASPTTEDLIRFSMPPLAAAGAGKGKEADLIRFSVGPGMPVSATAGSPSSAGDLIRFSTVGAPSPDMQQKVHHRRSKKPLAKNPRRSVTISDEAALPQRLQLNYNTDLRIGEALPSNNKEKRIYAGTLSKDQGFMPRRIAVRHVWRNVAETEEQAASGFVREVIIMAALSTNENVTRIVGYCTVPRVIVTDLYEGDLDFILGNRRFELPDSRGLSILTDVAKALAAIHNLGFAHGRLRPRAVLLERVKNTARVSVRSSILNFGGVQPAQPRTFWRARIGDFSASRPDGARESKARLAPRYAAPECIQGNRQVTSAGDVFSFGILAWQCLTRRVPWEGQEDGYIVWKVCEGERLSISDIPVTDSPIRRDLIGIIGRCCSENQDARPSMEGLLTDLERLRSRE